MYKITTTKTFDNVSFEIGTDIFTVESCDATITNTPDDQTIDSIDLVYIEGNDGNTIDATAVYKSGHGSLLDELERALYEALQQEASDQSGDVY